jgi:hypothetical protein
MSDVSDDRSEGLEKLEGPAAAAVTDCEGTHGERQVRMRELANVFIDIFFAERKEPLRELLREPLREPLSKELFVGAA